MRPPQVLFVGLLTIVCIAKCNRSSLAADALGLTLEQIACVGQPIGKASGAVTEISTETSLGDGGEVALVCATRGADGKPRRELWAGMPGHLALVARVDDAAPALSDKPTLKKFHLAGVDGAGRVLFDGETLGRASGLTSEVVWFGPGAFVGRLARAGEHLAGGDTKLEHVRAEAVSTSATVLLRAGASEYYLGRADQLSRITLPSTASKSRPDILSPSLAPAGQVIFATSAGLWCAHAGNNAARVAAVGDAAPGLEGKWTFAAFPADASKRFAMNERWRVAFWATANPPADRSDAKPVQGVWAGDGGAKLALLARVGDALPGCAADETLAWSDANAVSVDAAGAVLIVGEIRTTSGKAAYGVWLHSEGKLSLVARSGPPLASVRGFPRGVRFVATTPESARLSREGRVVQVVGITGPDLTPAGNRGIAIYERETGWELVARCGERVGETVLHSVDWVSDVNSLGQFLILAQVEGGTGVVLYRAQIPERKKP